MNKLSALLILAIVSSSLGMSLRNKRQAQDSDNDLEDRYGWDRQRPWFPGGQNSFPGQRPVRPRPDQGQRPWQQQQTPDDFGNNNGNNNGNTNNGSNNGNGNGSSTESSAVRDCIRQCPVTAEYNPVCGSNNVTYPNPGRLTCAQSCGVNVNLLRSSPCGTTTTTAAPN